MAISAARFDSRAKNPETSPDSFLTAHTSYFNIVSQNILARVSGRERFLWERVQVHV